MKIIINFSNEEKNAIINMALMNGGVKEVTDKDEHCVGNFGEYKYDAKENEITFDLKTSFIKATVGLVASLINIIRAFVSSCEMFSSAWFEDIKDLTKKEYKDEPNNSNEDFAAEVANKTEE